jgi:CheY-like chemotaxis protein
MRVLVVDDQPRARQSMRAVLGAWRCVDEVREAADGAEAVELAESFAPDVILTDVRMPKMSGLEALRLIKAKGRPVKVIVLSMYPELQAEALAAGADAFISKSDPLEKLRQTLTNFLEDAKC